MDEKKSTIDKFLIKEDEIIRAIMIVGMDVIIAVGFIYGLIAILKYI